MPNIEFNTQNIIIPWSGSEKETSQRLIIINVSKKTQRVIIFPLVISDYFSLHFVQKPIAPCLSLSVTIKFNGAKAAKATPPFLANLKIKSVDGYHNIPISVRAELTQFSRQKFLAGSPTLTRSLDVSARLGNTLRGERPTTHALASRMGSRPRLRHITLPPQRVGVPRWCVIPVGDVFEGILSPGAAVEATVRLVEPSPQFSLSGQDDQDLQQRGRALELTPELLKEVRRTKASLAVTTGGKSDSIPLVVLPLRACTYTCCLEVTGRLRGQMESHSRSQLVQRIQVSIRAK
eukprot:gnl/Dysnectes_brevis/5052_a7097_336.p1 GENE.gnl/Dysnectes_brevis/5052_a7097_336~~gnl/Dysnectes_brevis/5052_a7097_336.p1  ORF type:complete len:292 (+),score=79.28 gnl/Dysnectes_brevis/5052_a7097_336:65-940(+)